MYRWLFKNLFRERDRFTIPARPRRLPACRFRPFEEKDFDRCVEIYRLNEPGRFPAGYLDDFSAWLRGDGCLVLVCEVAGEIRAVGGVSMFRQDDVQLSFFSYGMVHPAYHRQGYGTASLLARIVSLGSPVHRWHGILSTTGGSESFYERFGFGFMDRYVGEREDEFCRFRSHIYPPEWQACSMALAWSNVLLELGGATVPLNKTKEPENDEGGAGS
jgi:GNAT superfamily N-acetyltransferase